MDNKFKWHMFVTSFIPLWISILIINLWDIISNFIHNWDSESTVNKNIWSGVKYNCVPIIFTLIILFIYFVSRFKILALIKNRGKLVKRKVVLTSYRKCNKLSTEFLLAYILPMIAFDFSLLKDVVIFVVCFLILAFLCIKNDNVYINIFLEFRGYKIYNCDIEYNVMDDKKNIYTECILISKVDITLPAYKEPEVYDFNNYIYISFEESKNE